jgi:hypothetical protein
MSKQKTLKQLSLEIDLLIREHPEYANLPVIYATDDEDNEYHPIYNEPTPMQVQDPIEHYVEVVGAKGDEDIADEDINAICIN